MIKKIMLFCLFMLWFANSQASILSSPLPSYIITAHLGLYDTNGDLITSVSEDGGSLYTSGSVIFSDESLVSDFIVHDFSIISDTSSPEVSMLLDWGLSTNVPNEENWIILIIDFFSSGVAIYEYHSLDTDLDGIPGSQLINVPGVGAPPNAQFLESGMTASFSLTIATGTVPAPPAAWLFCLGFMAFFSVFHKRLL